MHLTERLEAFDISACAAVMAEEDAPELALAMRDLYLECVRQVIEKDGIAFHALMLPTMKGGHFIYTVTDDGLDTDVGDILGVTVDDRDCVVLLDSAILGTDRTEHDMLKIVIADIASHVARTWKVPEPRVCPMGGQIGWAAVASTIAAAHDAIHLHWAREEINGEIKTAAINAITKASHPRKTCTEMPEPTVAMAVVEAVCDRALALRGNYLKLPAAGIEIADCARAMLTRVLDGPSTIMGRSSHQVSPDIR